MEIIGRIITLSVQVEANTYARALLMPLSLKTCISALYPYLIV